MHSSRMRTVRNSSRLLGGSASVHAGIPPPPPPGPGTPPWEHTPPAADPLGPGSPPPPRSRHHFPRADHPCGQTGSCKNITFATSLRTVITHLKSIFPLAIQSCKVKKISFCYQSFMLWHYQFVASLHLPAYQNNQADRQTHTHI